VATDFAGTDPATKDWRVGTVEKVIPETPRVKSFVFNLPGGQPHAAGQHYDIRLTAPDGYQAVRSYSAASPPQVTDKLELTVQILPDGEVSGYLDQHAKTGDRFEFRGPIGRYFNWSPAIKDPVVLIGGGSGVVPLMSMLREHQVTGARTPMTLIYSSRTHDDIIYQEELLDPKFASQGRRIIHTLTDRQPAHWTGYRRRVDLSMLTEILGLFNPRRLFYICGPTAMVEAMADLLVKMGYASNRIKTERFGPTG
jgi:ferredoxin-NADP reductase